jgi:serine/threonine protein phosphatase PrpC
MILEQMTDSQTHSQENIQDQFLPAAITDTGCERELNEDRYAVIESPVGIVWLICDGMGGVSGGELAAQLAIDSMRRVLESSEGRTPEEALRLAIKEANRVIVLRRQNQAFAQMGTTIVGAIFSEREVVLGNVGDSRAYLVRAGAIQQLSRDHTFVQELVDRGELAPDEALSHPKAHVLTRAIGAEPALEVEVKRYWQWDTSAGEVDSLVLCSDGLYSHVNDAEIAQIVSEFSPQRACAKLTELAKQRGGYDNITVAIIPLQGQVKKEAPVGYQEKLAKTRKKNLATVARKTKVKKFSGSALWWLLLISGLSLVAVVVAVLGVVVLANS